jgi:hypothetical protein
MTLIRSALVAIVGGLVGLAAESVHQSAGVWAPLGSQQLPVWIAAVYAPVLFVASLASSRFERRYDLVVSRWRLASEAGLFTSCFLAPVVLHDHEWALFLLTAAYLAARLRWGRDKGDWQVVAFVVLVDIAVEGTLVAASLYHYPDAHHLPLPLWLAPLWGGLAFSLRRFFRAIHPTEERTSPSRLS